MTRARLHRHRHHVGNIKCLNVKVLGIWISSAWCQRHSVMQSVMVGLCTEKHAARTAHRWQLMSQCFVSSAFCMMHAKCHSHTVSAIVYLFNTTPPSLPITAVQLVHWRFWTVWSVYGTHIPVFHLVVCSFFFFFFSLNGTWFCWLQLILHNLKYRSTSDLNPSGNCGLCQNTEITMSRQCPCWTFAVLEKRAKNAAAGSSEVLQEEEVVMPKHVWNLPSDDESEAVKVL